MKFYDIIKCSCSSVKLKLFLLNRKLHMLNNLSYITQIYTYIGKKCTKMLTVKCTKYVIFGLWKFLFPSELPWIFQITQHEEEWESYHFHNQKKRRVFVLFFRTKKKTSKFSCTWSNATPICHELIFQTHRWKLRTESLVPGRR